MDEIAHFLTTMSFLLIRLIVLAEVLALRRNVIGLFWTKLPYRQTYLAAVFGRFKPLVHWHLTVLRTRETYNRQSIQLESVPIGYVASLSFEPLK